MSSTDYLALPPPPLRVIQAYGTQDAEQSAKYCVLTLQVIVHSTNVSHREENCTVDRRTCCIARKMILLTGLTQFAREAEALAMPFFAPTLYSHAIVLCPPPRKSVDEWRALPGLGKGFVLGQMFSRERIDPAQLLPPLNVSTLVVYHRPSIRFTLVPCCYYI